MPWGGQGSNPAVGCGVASIVLEQHDGVAFHPKTRDFNTRTMEIARGWGREVMSRTLARSDGA
jgi:hypothetical protein